MSSACWNAAAPSSPGPSSSCGSRGKAEGAPEDLWGEKKLGDTTKTQVLLVPLRTCSLTPMRQPHSSTSAVPRAPVLAPQMHAPASGLAMALLFSKAAMSHWLLALPLWLPAQGLQPLGKRWQLPTAMLSSTSLGWTQQLLLWKSGLAAAQGVASHARSWITPKSRSEAPLKILVTGDGLGLAICYAKVEADATELNEEGTRDRESQDKKDVTGKNIKENNGLSHTDRITESQNTLG